MYLLKNHHLQNGIVNPAERKDLKLYCSPFEGCFRGPGRPFLQFFLETAPYENACGEEA
jgi:hypothetical protein